MIRHVTLDGPSRVETPRTTREAVAEFEGILMNEVFRAMRQTVPNSSVGGSFSQQVFTEMLDGEFARSGSVTLSTGLTEVLLKQLGVHELPAQAQNALHDGAWRTPIDDSLPPLNDAQHFGAERPGLRPDSCGEGHCGVDWAQPVGKAVRAVRDGVVRHRNDDVSGASGRWLELDHTGTNFRSRYLHLSELASDLRPGDRVRAGQVIGYVGATGTAAHGAHLHFELLFQGVREEATWVDPEPLMREWDKVAGGSTKNTTVFKKVGDTTGRGNGAQGIP